MTLEQQVVELEKALQTAAEAHHTALEVERQKKDYFNQYNQRLKAELERACDKLEVERAKVRELEPKVSFTHGLERLRDDLARQLKEAKTEVAELKTQLAQAQAALNPKIEPGTCSRCGNSTTLVQEVAHEYLCRGCIETSGWLSPDEAKALVDKLESVDWDRRNTRDALLEENTRLADESKALQAQCGRLRAVLEKCVYALDQEALAADHFTESDRHAAWFNVRALAHEALKGGEHK